MAEAGAEKSKSSKDDKKSHEKDKRDLQTSVLNFASRGSKPDTGSADVKPGASGRFRTPSPVNSAEATPDPISIYLKDNNERKLRELDARLEKEREDRILEKQRIELHAQLESRKLALEERKMALAERELALKEAERERNH